MKLKLKMFVKVLARIKKRLISCLKEFSCLKYLFFERGMRGEKVNRKFSKSYDPKQELKHVICLDLNNLYGYVMTKFLLTYEFKWLDLKNFDSNKYSSNSSKIYVLEVDLGYPKDLRELYNDYLLTPDKIEIKKEMLSSYQIKIANFYEFIYRVN